MPPRKSSRAKKVREIPPSRAAGSAEGEPEEEVPSFASSLPSTTLRCKMANGQPRAIAECKDRKEASIKIYIDLPGEQPMYCSDKKSVDAALCEHRKGRSVKLSSAGAAVGRMP